MHRLILLIHDRIFQILGINYRLDSWFMGSISNLDQNLNCSNVKHLTVIDIDTLIFISSYLVKGDQNFKELLKNHLTKMTQQKSVKGINMEQIMNRVNKNITEKLSPIADRMYDIDFDMELLIKQFKEIIKE